MTNLRETFTEEAKLIGKQNHRSPNQNQFSVMHFVTLVHFMNQCNATILKFHSVNVPNTISNIDYFVWPNDRIPVAGSTEELKNTFQQIFVIFDFIKLRTEMTTRHTC